MIALRASSVGKVNIGTALRQAFGSSLRKSVLSSAPEVFDRLALLKTVNEDMEAKAKELIKLLVNQEGE